MLSNLLEVNITSSTAESYDMEIVGGDDRGDTWGFEAPNALDPFSDDDIKQDGIFTLDSGFC